MTSYASVANSTLARGVARKLYTQSGWWSAPPFDPTMIIMSLMVNAASGTKRCCLDLAPVVVRRIRFASSRSPPTLPSLARNSAMTRALKSRQYSEFFGCFTFPFPLCPVELTSTLRGRSHLHYQNLYGQRGRQVIEIISALFRAKLWASTLICGLNGSFASSSRSEDVRSLTDK